MGDQDDQAVINQQAQVDEPESQRPDSEETIAEQPTEEAPHTDDIQQAPSQETAEGGDIEGKSKTRYERRIDKLVGKLKEQSNPKTNNEAFDEIFKANESLIKPEDYEMGLNPEDLDKRMEARRLADREQIKREIQAEQDYRNTVNEHLTDIDTVQQELGDNEILDGLVARLYDEANKMIDPTTGQAIFVPRVKMSDIYKDVKAAMDKNSTKAAAEVQAKVMEQASDQAVPPSVSKGSSTNLEAEAALEKARSTGRDEDWAEVLKRRLKS